MFFSKYHCERHAKTPPLSVCTTNAGPDSTGAAMMGEPSVVRRVNSLPSSRNRRTPSEWKVEICRSLASAGDKILPYTTEAGITLLWIAAILTIYTGYDYFRAGAKHMVD